MSESDTNQLIEKVEALWKSSAELLQTSVLVRGIGYGLLLLFLFDLIYLFIPPGFMNPTWELQTFGAIVERIAVPLIAFLLIFWGGRSRRFKLEFPLLKGLSWLSLLVAVLLFLAIPLGIINTVRLDQQANTQINNQVEQGKTQIKKIQEQVGNVTTEEQMKEFLAQFSRTGKPPKVEGAQLENVKNELLASLAKGESSLTDQAKSAQNNQRQVLLKNSVKWNLGSLVSAVLFLWIWFLTPWARRKK